MTVQPCNTCGTLKPAELLAKNAEALQCVSCYTGKKRKKPVRIKNNDLPTTQRKNPLWSHKRPLLYWPAPWLTIMVYTT